MEGKKKKNHFLVVNKLNLVNMYIYAASFFTLDLALGQVELFAWMSIPYRTGRTGRNIPYRPAIRYTRPPCFVPEKIPAVPASYRPYRPISGNTGRYRAYRPVQKKVFFFFFFLSFVIFEFLLGQNGNLFVLTY